MLHHYPIIVIILHPGYLTYSLHPLGICYDLRGVPRRIPCPFAPICSSHRSTSERIPQVPQVVFPARVLGGDSSVSSPASNNHARDTLITIAPDREPLIAPSKSVYQSLLYCLLNKGQNHWVAGSFPCDETNKRLNHLIQTCQRHCVKRHEPPLNPVCGRKTRQTTRVCVATRFGGFSGLSKKLFECNSIVVRPSHI